MPRGKADSKSTKKNHDAQRMKIASHNMLGYLKNLLEEWRKGYPIYKKGKELEELAELIASADPVPQDDMAECTWVCPTQTSSDRHENKIHVTYGDRQFTLCNAPTRRPNTHSFEVWEHGNPDLDRPRCVKCQQLSGDKQWDPHMKMALEDMIAMNLDQEE